MTLHNAKHKMGMCPKDGHDLAVAPAGSEFEGHYFCSNSRCKHSVKKLKKPVPSNSRPYSGPEDEA